MSAVPEWGRALIDMRARLDRKNDVVVAEVVGVFSSDARPIIRSFLAMQMKQHQKPVLLDLLRLDLTPMTEQDWDYLAEEGMHAAPKFPRPVAFVVQPQYVTEAMRYAMFVAVATGVRRNAFTELGPALAWLTQPSWSAGGGR